MKDEFHEWNVANKRFRLIGTVAFAEKAWNAAKESKWISVEDEMPEGEGFVICLFDDDDVEVFPIHEIVNRLDWYGCFITHWQPLPEKPKE